LGQPQVVWSVGTGCHNHWVGSNLCQPARQPSPYLLCSAGTNMLADAGGWLTEVLQWFLDTPLAGCHLLPFVSPMPVAVCHERFATDTTPSDTTPPGLRTGPRLKSYGCMPGRLHTYIACIHLFLCRVGVSPGQLSASRHYRYGGFHSIISSHVMSRIMSCHKGCVLALQVGGCENIRPCPSIMCLVPCHL
jgi:hypothetical protein